MRIGHGFDVHAFGGIGPIIIGGVNIPYKKGIQAHSDGDVLIHALIDALLGAVALGDIGKMFPEKNPTLKGISSRCMLRKTWKFIYAKGYRISNIDATIISQEPRMLDYIFRMSTFIAEDLNCNINKVNIKATTTEKLGYIGRSEGIACEVLVLLTDIFSN